MAELKSIAAAEIREIGEVLFGKAWQGAMARAIGVPRQSIGYYLRAGGVDGAQAAAIVGLVARIAASEAQAAMKIRANGDARQAELVILLDRFEARCDSTAIVAVGR